MDIEDLRGIKVVVSGIVPRDRFVLLGPEKRVNRRGRASITRSVVLMNVHTGELKGDIVKLNTEGIDKIFADELGMTMLKREFAKGNAK